MEGEEQETYLKRSSSWAHSASGASSPRSENSTVTAGMASDQFPLVDPVPSEQQPLLKEEDLEMAEAMMKFSHERRRSLEDLDTDPEIPTRPTRRRCKTGPSVDQNEVKQLFKSFEKDQAQRRSENLTSDFSKQLQQELHQLQTDTANASGNMSGACQTLDTPTLTNPHLSFEDVQGLQSDIKTFMELAERYSKFAIGAYGTNFLKIMGWVCQLIFVKNSII